MILIHYLLQLMKPRIDKAYYSDITNTVKYDLIETIMQYTII